MLDVIGNKDELGKNVGTDEGKNTFLQIYGLERCQSLVEEQTELALQALRKFEDHAFMHELSLHLTTRTA